MRRGRDAYLFADRADITNVVQHMREKLKSVLEAIDSSQLLAVSVDDLVRQIVDDCRLDVPTLLRDGIQQLSPEEVDIDVSLDPSRHFIRRGPHYVKGTAVRIAVPFTGDPALFKYPSSSYASAIDGEVDDHTVVLTYQAEKPDQGAVKKDFDHRMNEIDNALNFIRGKTEEWNTRLPDLVRTRIMERREKLERDRGFDLGYPVAPPKAKPAAAPGPAPLPPARKPARPQVVHYDLFLSHASEDKGAIARPLYEALTAAGLSVWFDEAVLIMGNSLRQKIDEGLARCEHGIVIVSPSFFSKRWPQKELDGLVAREIASGKERILPIWHDIDHEGVASYSPTLADRVAGRSSDGVSALVDQILKVLKKK